MPRRPINIAERFWPKVDKRGPDECWLWTGAHIPKGYGTIGLGGRKDGWGYAHRVSYEIENGPIPEGMCVLHKCDNPQCVNPAHLFLGTKLDNARDKVAKGRQPRGERHYRSKLTNKEVISEILSTTTGCTTLARKLGLSASAITAIRRGDRRRDARC